MPPVANDPNLLYPSMIVFGTRMQCIERSIQVAGEVALEAPTDLSRRLALSCSSVRVGPGCRIMSHSHDDGHVQGTVEPPIAAAIEAVSDSISR